MIDREITERPILFSAPMVRAILEGLKIQTRRILNPQPKDGVHECHYSPSGWAYARGNGCTCKPIPCRYAADRLWVQETWQAGSPAHHSGAGFAPFAKIPQARPAGAKIIYSADYSEDWLPSMQWRPSVHMPRWASRLTLEVTSIRVERLQDISPADAQAEGDKERSGLPEYHARGALCHVDWFRILWESINGPGATWGLFMDGRMLS